MLTAAQVATMLLNLAALVYSRNVLGAYWFGALQFGVAFSAYALVIAEWGLATLGVREVSRLETVAAVRRYVSEHLGLMAALGHRHHRGLGAAVAAAVSDLPDRSGDLPGSISRPSCRCSCRSTGSGSASSACPG